MRRLIVTVLAVCLLNTTAHADMPQAYGDEKEIWSYLVELCPTAEIAAGIMGWFFRESRLKSDAVAGWDIREPGICKSFAEDVDSGMPKEEFVERVQAFGGFGLGQWVSHDYIESLYDYSKTLYDHIADVKCHCEFAVWSIQQNEELWNDLLECTTAIQCGRRIGLMYDGTSAEGAEAIAGFADYYYRKMVSE